MIYNEWERMHLTEPSDFKYMYDSFLADEPTIGGWDTETTGLHIKKDTPFLIIFGWIKGETGRVFTFEPNRERMNLFFLLAEKLEMFIAHNTKYDAHMLSNIGYERQVQDMTNLVENMAIARLSLEAVPAREGGDSLALKDLGVRYVHHLANNAEKHINRIKKQLTDEKTKVLGAALKQFPFIIDGEQQFTPSGKPAKWGKGAVEKFLKDPTKDVEDLPLEVREVWEEFDHSEITYKDIYDHDPEGMIRYAGDDVITMLEFARNALPIVKDRQQLSVLQRENDVILPLYRMERAGLKVDRDYLEQSRLRVKAYIIERRNALYDLVGEKVTCNQHARIKEIFLEKWDIRSDASDNAAMKFVKKSHEGEPNEFASLISELRTLEKWYSTYIKRIQDNTEYDGYFYTQIAQCSAVSGRVGSDSQQFPKKSLKASDGTELFHPRKAFIVPEGMKWYFLDFSQIELRVAANYTLLVSGGDLNLCRAYMPFKCFKEGDTYYLDENPAIEWKATDIHAETTKQAYPDVDPTSDEFKSLRGTKGKPTNFLCLYGGTPKALAQTLDVSVEEATKLYNGYKKAFPQLDVYSQMVVRQHAKQGYVTNMLGRRYYLKDGAKAYKLGNFLIQGTCADDLKECIIEIDEFLKDMESKFVMTVHDELSFYVSDGEEWIVPKIRAIMQHSEWCKVPVVSDVEITTTNWYDKEDINV